MGGKRAVKARGERGGWEMCGDGSGRGRKFKARGERKSSPERGKIVVLGPSCRGKFSFGGSATSIYNDRVI